MFWVFNQVYKDNEKKIDNLNLYFGQIDYIFLCSAVVMQLYNYHLYAWLTIKPPRLSAFMLLSMLYYLQFPCPWETNVTNIVLQNPVAI